MFGQVSRDLIKDQVCARRCLQRCSGQRLRAASHTQMHAQCHIKARSAPHLCQGHNRQTFRHPNRIGERKRDASKCGQQAKQRIWMEGQTAHMSLGGEGPRRNSRCSNAAFRWKHARMHCRTHNMPHPFQYGMPNRKQIKRRVREATTSCMQKKLCSGSLRRTGREAPVLALTYMSLCATSVPRF